LVKEADYGIHIHRVHVSADVGGIDPETTPDGSALTPPLPAEPPVFGKVFSGVRPYADVEEIVGIFGTVMGLFFLGAAVAGRRFPEVLVVVDHVFY